jgi:protein disulfide-isomerase A1
VQDVGSQQLEDFTTSDDYVFVARLQNEDESLDARFRSLAQEFSDRYSFGIAGSDSTNGVWCYNNVDGLQHTAEDLDDANSLKKLVDLCTAELIPQLTRRNEMTYLSVSPKRALHVLWKRHSLTFYFHPYLVRTLLSLLPLQ